jgi:hypothetical protein
MTDSDMVYDEDLTVGGRPGRRMARGLLDDVEESELDSLIAAVQNGGALEGTHWLRWGRAWHRPHMLVISWQRGVQEGGAGPAGRCMHCDTGRQRKPVPLLACSSLYDFVPALDAFKVLGFVMAMLPSRTGLQLEVGGGATCAGMDVKVDGGDCCVVGGGWRASA